ncbi:ferrichrome-binding periplasmic protein precursor [Aquitalea magnusonii]|uniref:Ferrichrome-binding periplasmic protein n=1 Tax=Aquitalea magnusonii TaxID=332411 RepID=A0A3G9GJ90_9NEIS|nr:iron-siderophore ABC transporter substrate-binding protein [Aquitalea magnusonii]BBF86341.1 ferrichrome-binding periplasmic protein precursor [Aquitalea magnusonii]
MRLYWLGVLLCWAVLGCAFAGGIDELAAARAQPAAKRIVALSWEAAENLLELGITPLAVADADDYRRWVAQPLLPGRVLSAGSRLEPNLELLASLKPDLILSSPVLGALRPRLQAIAPVLTIDAFRQDEDHAQAAEAIFLQLGRVLGRQPQARARLGQLAQGFAQLRAQLQAHGARRLPRVQVIRFANASSVYVYGSNAMPVLALRRLGLNTTGTPAASVWGIRQQRVVDMAAWQDEVVLYQQPFAEAGRLFVSPLWQGMPFVRQQRLAAVAPAWSYGGVGSLYYLAQRMTAALLQLPLLADKPVAANRPSLRSST